MNAGVGVTYQFNRWLGLNADFRHFVVNASRTHSVNRVAAGLSLSLR